MVDKIFEFSERKTNLSREVLAGVTTFLTMAYIIFIQPVILSTDFAGQPTGMDFGAIILATCLVSGLTTICMGLLTNYPIALAPGMGENFFFVSVVMSLSGLGIANAWQTALGIVFISGVIFFVLSSLGVREAIVKAISPSMRSGIVVGIGLFITFIGLQHGNLIVAKAGTMVGLNTHFVSNEVAVFFLGLMVTSSLQARGVRGSILWGIFSATLLALFLGEITFSGVFGFPEIKSHIAFKMDIKSALSLTCFPFIIVFLFMDMFDTVGTMIGVTEAAGLMKNNELPKAKRVLLVDAGGTVAGACLGTSTITSYIESAAGVAYGGRTGLTSVTVGILFLLSLFFSPLISMIGQYPPITAPALILVGVMMLQNVKKIDWEDYSESIPVFLTIVGIPFCYSIGDGLALGFMSYPLIKLLSGRGKEVSWVMYAVGVLLFFYFIFIRARLG